jgi:hypothetical protein
MKVIILCKSLEKLKNFLEGYPTELVKIVEQLLELFLNQNFTNLKKRKSLG